MSDDPQFEDKVGANLRARRPAPRREFGDVLRERLTALEAAAKRPEHLRTMVAAYAGSGTLLLILAALGASGSGPFG
jgi:hypothetical protein